MVRFIEVGEFQISGISEQTVQGEFFAELDAESYVTQEDGLGERSGEIEVRTSRLAAFAGLDPFLIMLVGTRDAFRNLSGVFGAVLWKDAIVRALRTAED